MGETKQAVENVHLLSSLVVPRPIAWITSLSPAGVRNLAPYSYFNIITNNPPTIYVSFGQERRDTLDNIRLTGDFVVNIVSAPLAPAMVESSASLPADVDEVAHLGLETVASRTVAAPRLAEARAALECTLYSTQMVGANIVVFGAVQHIYVADTIMQGDRVISEALAPVGRLGGSWYSYLEKFVRLKRPD